MSNDRYEYKYIIDATQRKILLMKASVLMRRDAHVREDGTYLIRSLYFDDRLDTCFHENEAGTDPRSKFRIRYYNGDTSLIQLEKKSKRRGMARKEACRLSEEEVRRILSGEMLPPDSGMSAEKRRLLWELQSRGLKPKVIVTYRRTPFVYPAGNVRVTFDDSLTSSDELDRFLDGDYRERPVLPAGSSILEVKWDGLLPPHIKSLLQLDTLQWSAFSKYYHCRVQSL